MIYRPGQTVPASGIYSEVNAYGYVTGGRVTVVKGEPFPPTSYSGHGYKLSVLTNR
ncbi:YjzC family protein [Paenarthrobacter nicotinovorans]|uniref:YjzC family protein n=1 Tax=Paenarthrobacter nicotinovorans TaxID=29320 RepID=UPI003D67006F